MQGGGGCRKAGAADCGIEANSFVAIYSVRNAAWSDAGVCAESRQRGWQCLGGRRSPAPEWQRAGRINTQHSRKSRKFFLPYKTNQMTINGSKQADCKKKKKKK